MAGDRTDQGRELFIGLLARGDWGCVRRRLLSGGIIPGVGTLRDVFALFPLRDVFALFPFVSYPFRLCYPFVWRVVFGGFTACVLLRAQFF